MNKAFLCLGGNLGNRAENLATALRELGAEGTVNRVSPVYETPGWGTTSHKKYLNQVVEYLTVMPAPELLKFTAGIENKMGRQRNGEKNNDRGIDIDILFFNSEVISASDLHIPHPRMHLRRFVLKPLCDLCPSFVHPVFKKTVSRMLLECTDRPEIVVFHGSD